nr:sugar transferase [Cellulomonas sp. APG4]
MAADRGLEWASSADRRGVAAEPRRSWASAQPFVVRRTPFNDASARAHMWAQLAGHYRRRVIAVDAAAALAVGGLVALWTTGLGPASVAVGVSLALVFVALVALVRGYETRELGDGPAEFQSILRAGAWLTGLLVTAEFLLGVGLTQVQLATGAPALVLVTIVGRYAHRRVLHRARAHGVAMMRTLVVGEPDDVARVVDDLGRAPYHGYQVAGACIPSLDGDVATDVPVLGAVADIPQVVADRAIDVVVLAGQPLGGDALRRLSWALDRVGAQLIVVPDIVEVAAPRLTVRPTAGLSLLEVEVGAPRRRLLVKAVIDRVVGTAALLLAAPVIGVAALTVRITSPGPAFYAQTRVGVDGRTFTLWKIRSMYTEADQLRKALLEHNEGAGPLFKMRHDPRVTPVGRVLRRFSLDELPQLVNVVRGEMSLVGPRPPLVEEVAGYPDPVHRRLRVKPGLTGLWQVSGRSDLSWEESVRLDLRYTDNWSVAMDLTILWKTARAVLRGSGAY